MRIYHRIENGTCFVNIIGSLALTETVVAEEYIKPLIVNPEVTGIVLNCDQVEIIDSRGIGLIAALLKDTEERDKKIFMCDLNRNCYHVIKTLKLHKMIKTYETEKELIETEMDSQG